MSAECPRPFRQWGPAKVVEDVARRLAEWRTAQEHDMTARDDAHPGPSEHQTTVIGVVHDEYRLPGDRLQGQAKQIPATAVRNDDGSAHGPQRSPAAARYGATCLFRPRSCRSCSRAPTLRTRNPLPRRARVSCS